MAQKTLHELKQEAKKAATGTGNTLTNGDYTLRDKKAENGKNTIKSGAQLTVVPEVEAPKKKAAPKKDD